MKKLFALVAACAILSACAPDPIPESTTYVGDNIHLEKMFVHEGCTMYRFKGSANGGSYHYWADCRGQVDSQVPSGKTTRPDDIQTVH